jgi:hypothetical protein
MNTNACRQWLIQERYRSVAQFLEKFSNPATVDADFLDLCKYPSASYNLIKQFFIPNHIKQKMVLDRLRHKGLIVVVVGMKGGGKTACVTGWAIPELMRLGEKVTYCGMPQAIPLFLNDDYRVKKACGSLSFKYDFYSVPADNIIVQDESAIIENAKNYNDKNQKEREDILPILRHKGNTVFYLSQQFSFVSKRIRDLTDAFIVKPFNLMQVLKENKGEEFPFPPIVAQMLPKIHNELMFIDGKLGILCLEHDIEQWYKDEPDKWGKSFKNIESEAEAQEFIRALFNNNYPPERVRHFLRLRGYDAWTLQDYVEYAKKNGYSLK